MEESVPIASDAACSPHAAPAPRHESKILTLEGPLTARPAAEAPEPEAPPAPAPVQVEAPRPDPMSALRDIARRLRTSPDSDETLQFVVDTCCACTGSNAGMLTIQVGPPRQLVSGTAMGAGPYISIPLRAGGPSLGELVLTRLADAEEYSSADETFADLVSEYIAKGISASRVGTVLSQDSQDFVDRMTEELRSPLASTANVLSTALGAHAAAMPDDLVRYLRTAAADAGRLLSTIDDLLTLAHLRPPELREMETIPVTPWLERCVDAAQEAARLRGVTLEWRAPAQAYLVQGVVEQLDRVAAQLIGNAIKFTEAGGRVDVTAGIAEGMLRVTVRDTGIGFDAADATRMTDLFSRAISAEAARIPGLGVGLFLANEIVKNHGGRLWLDSARDQGTQAHVALPPREPGSA